MLRASTFLSEAERASLTAALESAESQTTGEIVTAIATSSGRYDRSEDFVGLITAVVFVVVGWFLYPPLDGVGLDYARDWGKGADTGGVLLLQIALMLVGFIVGRLAATQFPSIAMPLISKKEMAEEVERRAHEIFYREGVRSTKGATGVLIYISLFERMVRILPDEAIAKAVSPKQWDEICKTLVDAIKRKHPAEGLREAVSKSGQLLSQFFPLATGRGVNELRNTIRIYD
jgi:putative membrane protein